MEILLSHLYKILRIVSAIKKIQGLSEKVIVVILFAIKSAWLKHKERYALIEMQLQRRMKHLMRH